MIDSGYLGSALRGLAAAIEYGYPQVAIDELAGALADWLINPPTTEEKS